MSPTTTRTPLTMLRLFTLAIAAVVTLGVTGCAANFEGIKGTGQLEGSPDQGTALKGKVFGGNLPIVGGTVQLYAVGTTGYGSAATPLIPSSTPVTTVTGGLFNISGDYTCPSNSYVYLTISGGNPGLAGNNPAIALMTALGPCSGLGSIGFINVNELTTVAGVWAMQQFASTTNGTPLSATPNPTTAADTFGSSSTNSQGVANAMGVANVLVNLQTGVTPSTDTSGNQLNVEYWQINTIADILASCVNSDGTNTSPCNTLFTNTGGAADTIQAALYMAKNPSSNVTTLTGLVTGTPSFTPADTSTNDFTIGLSYQTGTSATRWIAIDGYGNAWVTAGSAVYELDPTGNKITTPTNYLVGSTSTAIGTAYEVAVDTSNNAWFTDNTKFNIFEVKGSGSAGGANGGAGTAVASGASSALEAIAVDGNNNVWATATSAHVYELPSGSTTITTGGTTTSNPFGMAIDLSNSPTSPNYTVSNGGSFLYAINSGGCVTAAVEMGGVTSATGGSMAMDYTTGGGTFTAGQTTALNYIVDAACNNTMNIATQTPSGGVPYAGTTPYVFMSTPYGIAIDNSNNLWIVNQNYVSTTDKTSLAYSLTKASANYSAGLTPSKAVITYSNFEGGGLSAPFYLAMDGASAAWVANSTGGAVSAFTNAGTPISPSTGLYGGTYVNGSVTYKRTYGSPRGIAVDGSGNVWVANTSTVTMPGGSSAVGFVTVTVGAATPTVTPLALGISNDTLASKP